MRFWISDFGLPHSNRKSKIQKEVGWNHEAILRPDRGEGFFVGQIVVHFISSVFHFSLAERKMKHIEDKVPLRSDNELPI
jgi:hypothetical protein